MQEINHIAPDHITAAGVEIGAEYRISSTGRSITARLTIDGQPFRLVLSGARHGDVFLAALRAAKRGETVDVDGEGLSLVLADAVPVEIREKIAPSPDKMAHGPVPEKWFIGQKLTGKNFEIRFDGDAGKTRVIFKRKPSEAVLEAVKAAGFYWSPSLKSWNKGLNFRAFRAAEKLRDTLNNIAA